MTTIEVPGEITLFRSYNVPPERVTLPMAVNARLGWMFLVQLAGGLALLPVFILPLFPIFGVLCAAVPGWSQCAGPPIPFLHTALITFVGIPMVALAVGIWGSLVTWIVDASRRGPTLELKEEGLIDHRTSDELVPWSDIAQAKFIFTRAGITSVRLKLRCVRQGRWNPFRMGVVFFRWRRDPSEMWVPVVMGLSASPHVIAHAIAALVKSAGGEVETKPELRLSGASRLKKPAASEKH